MGLSLETSVPVLTVFYRAAELFSPCAAPCAPLRQLSGGRRQGRGQRRQYPLSQGRVLVNTLFFVVGISFTFSCWGSALQHWEAFPQQPDLVCPHQRHHYDPVWPVPIRRVRALGRPGAEHRLPFRLDRWAMNPLVALVLGFTFSFAWTPCVGTLGSVLLMASSAGSAAAASC